MNYIYALCDPRDNAIRYVGKTDNPGRRYQMHLKSKEHCHRVHWIQALLKIGLKPAMTIIERIPSGQNWESRERYWIKHYRDTGCNLTNMSDGGDCGPDLRGKHLVKSEAARRNIIAALVKRNKSPEMREASRRHGLANKGRKQSLATRAKISAAQTGKNRHTEKSIHMLIERNKTRKYDHKKAQEAGKRAWANPTTAARMRERLVKMNKDRIGKPDHRVFDPAKMRASARKLWDDPIKGAEARTKLAERNRRRANISQEPTPSEAS